MTNTIIDNNEFHAKIKEWLNDLDFVEQAKWTLSEISSEDQPNTVQIQVLVTKTIDQIFQFECRGICTTKNEEESIRSAVESMNERILLFLQHD